MFLLIDTSDRYKNKLVLFDKHKNFSDEFVRRDVDLVESAVMFFKKHKTKFDDLKGVAVIVGKGGFTGTRVATTFANTLIYTQQIPGITITEKQSLKPEKLIKKFKKQKANLFLSATYSGKPNITKSGFWKRISGK
jgi:tRNA A37 threonylcarbamoyladenosine modification protein TsaB